jgi:transcriptional regulator with XRE-family HTH domain
LAGATILPFRAMDEQMPNRIRELRKARGLKIEQLADRVGCGITYVSDIERGKRELSYHWMKRFARALKVQPADLLAEEGQQPLLAPDERELVDLYRADDPVQQQQLLQMARILVGPPSDAKRAGEDPESRRPQSYMTGLLKAGKRGFPNGAARPSAYREINHSAICEKIRLICISLSAKYAAFQ